MTLDEERKKLIDHLKGWQDCINTKCEDCSFSNPIGTKRVCTVMDASDLIDLALKVLKNDEILLKEQEARIKKYEYLFDFLGIGFREWATKILDGEAEAICEADEHEHKTVITFKLI